MITPSERIDRLHELHKVADTGVQMETAFHAYHDAMPALLAVARAAATYTEHDGDSGTQRMDKKDWITWAQRRTESYKAMAEALAALAEGK